MPQNPRPKTAEPQSTNGRVSTESDPPPLEYKSSWSTQKGPRSLPRSPDWPIDRFGRSWNAPYNTRMHSDHTRRAALFGVQAPDEPPDECASSRLPAASPRPHFAQAGTIRARQPGCPFVRVLLGPDAVVSGGFRHPRAAPKPPVPSDCLLTFPEARTGPRAPRARQGRGGPSSRRPAPR